MPTIAAPKATFREQVRDWLLDTYAAVGDEGHDAAYWQWALPLTPSFTVKVAQRKDTPNAIMVMGVASIPYQYAMEFNRLTPTETGAFVAECQRELVIAGSTFVGDWQGFRALWFAKTVYHEELALPTLVRAISAVNNGWLLVYNVICNAFPGVWEGLNGITPSAPVDVRGKGIGFKSKSKDAVAPQPDEGVKKTLDKLSNL